LHTSIQVYIKFLIILQKFLNFQQADFETLRCKHPAQHAVPADALPFPPATRLYASPLRINKIVTHWTGLKKKQHQKNTT